MGCFVSTNKHTPLPKFPQYSSTSSSSRAPPPVDVETVKEVLSLSETPNLNPFMAIEDDPETNSSRHNSFQFPPQHQILEDPIISEIGSMMSENISTTTFDDEDNDVYRRKLINRSPAKSRNQNQVIGVLQPTRKSPARNREQSPRRVKEQSPGRAKERSLGRVKEWSPGRVRLVGERNGRESGFGSAGRQRPGSGNVAAARSRSPAKRTVVGGGAGGRNEVGRSLSGRKTGKSPGRVGSDLHERVRKPELRSGRERDQSRRFTNGANKDESLENPLVSLECFIFL